MSSTIFITDSIIKYAVDIECYFLTGKRITLSVQNSCVELGSIKVFHEQILSYYNGENSDVIGNTQAVVFCCDYVFTRIQVNVHFSISWFVCSSCVEYTVDIECDFNTLFDRISLTIKQSDGVLWSVPVVFCQIIVFHDWRKNSNEIWIHFGWIKIFGRDNVLTRVQIDVQTCSTLFIGVTIIINTIDVELNCRSIRQWISLSIYEIRIVLSAVSKYLGYVISWNCSFDCYGWIYFTTTIFWYCSINSTVQIDCHWSNTPIVSDSYIIHTINGYLNWSIWNSISVFVSQVNRKSFRTIIILFQIRSRN